ncbi:MAG TPA: hypothetical protein VMR90_02975 [Candidatus Cybelea sp.]|nr:hypothetical protein [Candidatus Cybelea sp.]
MKFLPFVIACGVVGFAAQMPTAKTQNPPKVSDAIHQLFAEDGEDAGNGISKFSEEQLTARGNARREKVRALLAAGELKTGEDFHEAAFIFQHRNNPEDYLFAHVLAMEAVVKGSDEAKWIEAATMDRYLQSIGQPQVFGTQYPLDPNLPHQSHPPAGSQAAFRSGRTLAPYNEQFLPDSARLDFCVPALAQQKENLAMFNAGKRPTETMRAPGCPR